MKNQKLFMRLQEDEDFADAGCGCILQLSPVSGMNGVPEFLMCQLHRNAARMVLAARKVISSREKGNLANAVNTLDRMIQQSEGVAWKCAYDGTRKKLKDGRCAACGRASKAESERHAKAWDKAAKR